MAEHSIPRELVALLPTDPDQQLELAHRLASLAFTSKAAQLEAENAQLRQSVMQRQSQIKALERRVTNLELEVNEAQEKARQSLEEQTKLVGEKNALINTVKKLNRDLAKLDNFKRNLLQTLQDDEDVKDQLAAGADYTSDRLVSSVLSSVHAESPAPTAAVPATPASAAPDAGANVGLSPSMYATPGSGASPDGAGARVDGKEFFRQARARLQYEQFSQFLQNIKELNAHKQDRDQTLARAKEIFGSDNADLYQAFEALLSRHLPL